MSKQLCKYDASTDTKIPGESEGVKYPTRYTIRAKDSILCRVIPNEEQVSACGIVLPDSRLCQEFPTAAYIVKVGDVNKDKYPWAKVGTVVRYPMHSGQMMTWQWSQEDFLFLHCDAVYAYTEADHE